MPSSGAQVSSLIEMSVDGASRLNGAAARVILFG
jgi:hypothetical protein